MQSKGRQLHAQEEQARESGQFAEALSYSDQAFMAYQEDKDFHGLSELMAARLIIFKHLYQTTADQSYAIMAKHTAQASVEIAEQYDVKPALALAYKSLGEYYQLVQEWSEAASAYATAAECMLQFSPEATSRPAVLLDIQGHQYAAEYLSGDKGARERAEQALSQLEQAEEADDYNKKVWITGAQMRMALMLKDDDNQAAQDYLMKAKAMIDADERLKLRLGQWNQLVKVVAPEMAA